MNLNVEIGFEQLLFLVKQLPEKQRKLLAEALASAEAQKPSENKLQKILLTGPVWSEEEYRMVLKTEEQIDQLAAGNGIN